MIKFTITFELPAWLVRAILVLVLTWRRLRYGYAFRRIPLTQGRFAIVDPQDYQRLSQYKWRLCRTKGKNMLYADAPYACPAGNTRESLCTASSLKPPKDT